MQRGGPEGPPRVFPAPPPALRGYRKLARPLGFGRSRSPKRYPLISAGATPVWTIVLVRPSKDRPIAAKSGPNTVKLVLDGLHRVLQRLGRLIHALVQLQVCIYPGQAGLEG